MRLVVNLGIKIFEEVHAIVGVFENSLETFVYFFFAGEEVMLCRGLVVSIPRIGVVREHLRGGRFFTQLWTELIRVTVFACLGLQMGDFSECGFFLIRLGFS